MAHGYGSVIEEIDREVEIQINKSSGAKLHGSQLGCQIWFVIKTHLKYTAFFPKSRVRICRSCLSQFANGLEVYVIYVVINQTLTHDKFT